MARDRWYLLQNDVARPAPGVFSDAEAKMLGFYDPRGSEGFTGLWLVRGGHSVDEIVHLERKAADAAQKRDETYKPLVWRIPLYLGDPIRIGGAHGEIVMRQSGLCMKCGGRFRSKLKDGKRERVWTPFRVAGGFVFQELVTPRLIGQARVRRITPKKQKKAKVAA